MFYHHSKNTRKKVLKFRITGYWHPRTRLTKEGRNCYIGNYLKRSNSFWCSKFESFLHVVVWFSFIPSFFLCCGCSPITQHLLRFSFYRRSWIVQHHRVICNSVSLDLLVWNIPPPPPNVPRKGPQQLRRHLPFSYFVILTLLGWGDIELFCDFRKRALSCQSGIFL